MGKAMFPTMSTGDIVNSLGAWGVPIVQEQLHRPSPDFVEGVYCACLFQVTNINHETLREPVQKLLNQAQTVDKDLHATSLASHILLYHLTRLAMAARIEDFSSKDIQFPERERTLFLLSAFINFVKFTEQFCEPFVKKLRDRSDDIVAERDRVSRRLSDITQEIDVMKAKMAEDEPRCEQLRAENSSLRAKMFATKEFQVATVEEVEKLRAEKSALVERKEALNGEIASISEAMTRTRSRIVQSPERIKRTITTMSTTAVEDKQTVALHEAKARDLQAKINAFSNIEKEVRGCIEQLQTIEKEVHSLQESQKDLHELKDLLEDKQIERKELHQRQERVQKQLSNAQEKLERAQRHAEDRKVASQKTIDRLQREYDEMAIERRDNDKQVEELRAEANELETKMAEHLKTNETELNQLISEYWKLRNDTDLYMETLANKLNMKVDFT
ncbi:Nuf2 family-domain-containing protein [Mycena alexandri]|uniref:Nuf2 family-domain-containing protein n=1 Tax=Mycena alexandri TaxID=1745969 RepID=A0AAD6TE14_9AGAR|nr:Nuf2 family-domain-containing protein [Mycena alexandri]